MNDITNERIYREEQALKDGDVICCKDAEYTIIGNPIGFGGSSILYGARKSGSEMLLAIKECFPAEGCCAFKRINGVIQPKDPDDGNAVAILAHFRDSIENEKRIGQHIFNTTNRAVPTIAILEPISVTTGGKTYTQVSTGIFSVQPRFDLKARSLEDIRNEINTNCSNEERRKTKGLPNIYFTACLMEEVLKALQQIHKARDPKRPKMQGWIFGDLSPKNIFFAETNVAHKQAGIAHFLDYGSSMELDEKGETKELSEKDIFSTDGYRPPEVSEGGRFKLDQHADIYSAGCLLYRCVVSNAKFAMAAKKRSPALGPAALDDIDGKHIGCTGRALTLLNEILDKATKEKPSERYPDVNAMLTAIRALIEHLRPPKNQLNLSFSSLAPGEFRGREEEIKAIDCRIKERRKPIELYGFGGMGKSELSIEYCRRKMESNGIRVHFVRFDKTMRNTVVGPIADAFSGYSRFTEQGVPKSESVIYSEVMKMLGEQSEDDILCIDNVDSETEEYSELCGKEYADLCRLKMNLIITTRFDRAEFGGIEVGALQRKHLYNLIAHILKESPLILTEKQMDDLIQAVDSHTLAVELIARTLKMNRPRLTPKELLEKLQSGDLGGTSFTKVASHKDRDLQKRRIEDHIKILFQITSLPPEELSYMKNASLMDIRHGLPYDWFAEAQPNFDQDIIENLINRGWINLNRQNDFLRIHPLIHSLSQKELGASIESNSAFLSSLWAIFERYRFDGNKGRPIASLFAELPPILQNWIPEEWVDILCDWYDVSIDKIKLGILIKEQRISAYKAVVSKNYEDALAYITNVISIIEKNQALWKRQIVGIFIIWRDLFVSNSKNTHMRSSITRNQQLMTTVRAKMILHGCIFTDMVALKTILLLLTGLPMQHYIQLSQ